jgi:hypothetical protein
MCHVIADTPFFLQTLLKSQHIFNRFWKTWTQKTEGDFYQNSVPKLCICTVSFSKCVFCKNVLCKLLKSSLVYRVVGFGQL